jgi:hypothetical protein
MALYCAKEQVMSAVSALGFKVFRNGQFHWNSSQTPDSLVNKNSTIHRWTDSWHGDLIDFIKEVKSVSFKEAKRLAEELINTKLKRSLL